MSWNLTAAGHAAEPDPARGVEDSAAAQLRDEQAMWNGFVAAAQPLGLASAQFAGQYLAAQWPPPPAAEPLPVPLSVEEDQLLGDLLKRRAATAGPHPGAPESEEE